MLRQVQEAVRLQEHLIPPNDGNLMETSKPENDRNLSELSELIPLGVREILGRPALVGSDSEDAFYQMMAMFVAELDPQTITEWTLIFDLTNINWELRRYRRMKATFIQFEIPNTLNRLLEERSSYRGPIVLR